MAKGDRDVAKEQQWRDVLGRQGSSGLNARAFCRQEQITESAFHFWRRTIRERDDQVKPASPFVRAVVTREATSEASFTLELADGRVLRMPSISAEQLADLIVALEARRPR